MTKLLLVAGFGCAVDAPIPPTSVQPNILLVSVDTLRADHTTPYGYTRDTTPVLSKLAREGTRFNAAFSQANESAWSHAALLAGRYASELASPVYATYAIPESATLVSEALAAYGYATAGFSAGGHVTADFGYDQGWDRWSAEPGFASFYDTGPKAVQWISELPENKPWFVFLHGYDAHRPYSRPGPWDHLYARGEGSRLAEALCKNPCISEMVLGDALFPEVVPSWFTHAGGDAVLDPETYARLAATGADSPRVAITAADKQHVLDHYDGAVRYADTQLGLTLARLEANGDLDNTVVIVLSDHGEDLLDHGYMNHRTGLFDSCTHVPLVAWGPGFEGGVNTDQLVDGRDVARTVLAVAGALPPSGSGGRDLREVRRGETPLEVVFAEGVMDMVTARTATHRLVVSGVRLADPGHAAEIAALSLESARFALYDLAADPGEQHDVHASDVATTAALRDRIVAWREGIVAGTHALSQEEVSPEVAKSLREHGYWEAGGDKPAVVTTAAPPIGAPSGGAGPEPVQSDAACKERFEFLPGGG
ncbi:arylsulfatase [Deltaproteobacteria bacterium]|nr:arylsulfatase [Deltaproteobacteria bacterium]